MRRIGRVLAGTALFVLLVLALLETALRLVPGLVKGRLANAVYSVYGGDGIYLRDPGMRMNFMWPDYTTRAYWNGYWWTHRTDSWGFRNPPGLPARSLALLGDSLIYGHGVDEEDTVAHFLRTDYGRAAYNMGRQGDCLYQEYVLARLFLPRLRPATLALFVFLNDFRDLEVYRQPEQIADPPELDRVDYDALFERVVLHAKRRFRLGEALRNLRVVRLGDGIAESLRSHPDPARDLREILAPIFEDARFEPIARYYRLVLADLARRAHEQGTEFVVVLIEVRDEAMPNASAAQAKLLDLLQSIGAQDGFRVLGTREIFHDCPQCFLPNDGHLSREGHRRLAAFVADRIPAPAPEPAP